MKKKPFQFLQSQTFLALIVISVLTVVFVSVGMSSYHNIEENQPKKRLRNRMIKTNMNRHAQEPNVARSQSDMKGFKSQEPNVATSPIDMNGFKSRVMKKNTNKLMKYESKPAVTMAESDAETFKNRVMTTNMNKHEPKPNVTMTQSDMESFKTTREMTTNMNKHEPKPNVTMTQSDMESFKTPVKTTNKNKHAHEPDVTMKQSDTESFKSRVNTTNMNKHAHEPDVTKTRSVIDSFKNRVTTTDMNKHESKTDERMAKSDMENFKSHVMENIVDIPALGPKKIKDQIVITEVKGSGKTNDLDINALEHNTEKVRTVSNRNNNKKQNKEEPKVIKSNEKCVKRLPQAIIVGIQKSGTTALLQFLSDHPQIAACLHPIETMYFSMRYNKPLSWYRNLMPCSYKHQVTIEKDPPYFYRRFCAQRIRRMNPKTKIIIIVKDPITRAASMYAMLKEHHATGGKSFEQSVTFKTQAKINGNSRYIDFSDYPKHMKAWLDNFKQKQILVVDGHNFEDNPAEELNRVEKFLGIDTYFTTDRFTFNKTKGKYCVSSDEGEIKCLSKNKGRQHPKINKETRDMLERYFRPKNKQFYKMINRDLDWGY